MPLKSEKITIDSVEYEVREMPVRVLLPLAAKLSDGGPEAQIDLVGVTVFLNGEAIGVQAAGDLGASAFMPLVQAVLRVNGMVDSGNAN